MMACKSTRGVFGQQFDPLVFENFSKFTTKRAKMTVKEETWPGFGLSRVNHPYIDYLFDNIAQFLKFQFWNCPLYRGVTPEIS